MTTMSSTKTLRIFLYSFLASVALVLLSFGLPRIASCYFTALSMPRMQFDNEEGALLYQSLQLSAGKSIYVLPHDLTCAPNAYPPFYFALASFFSDNISPTFTAGRVLSGLAFALILLSIFLICLSSPGRKQSYKNIITGLFAIGLVCMTYEFPRWVCYYRVDMLALALSLLGLVILTTFKNNAAASPHLLRQLLAILCLILGWYTKQTMIAAPLTAMIFMFMYSRKSGLRFTLILGVGVSIVFLLLSILTKGNFFRLCFLNNINTYRVTDLVIWSRHVLNFYGLWLLSAIIIVSLGLRSNGRKLSIWLIYFGAALPGFLAIGKNGSAENYLLEPLVALAILTALAFECLFYKKRPFLLTLVPAVLLALYCRHQIHLLNYIYRTPFPATQTAYVEWNRLATMVRQEVIREHQTWSEPAMLNLLSGQPIYYQPFIMTELTKQHKADSTAFVNALETRYFSLLVTLHNFNLETGSSDYLEAAVQAIRDNYTLIGQIGNTTTPIGPLRHFFVYRSNDMLEQK